MPLIEERRRKPGTDMISAMAVADVDGERLTDLEILATCNMMTTAGGGTSRSAIAMSLWWLHQFPDELAKLKADPKLIIGPPKNSFAMMHQPNAASVLRGRF